MVLLNLLTFGLWSKVGRLTHYAFDAVLTGRHEAVDRIDVSTISPDSCNRASASGLFVPPSGYPRPSFKTEKVAGENKEVSRWIDKYLGVGEWVMDQSVAFAGSSGFFERRR
ncbi:hypothetical protein MAC_02386 [Metarhizium acridum CQMa 102]|uniref:DUF1748 domain containing protein n=1 Tax=Metarhizium acridum (strain CQMa 102) TaxID=655827 RepID=E9DXN8_METAQ|nr:uncharacterized protein MAC_02386 [Metarhizium acridum CQMa 102]EFY91501.1 hypothetical protein MAC_02386 [Metarhizium acridum CQMa 102]